jgi:orotate phosphoribosyltransferase
MSEAESELLRLIRERAFRTGTFRLASGDTSNYYIDGKMIEVFSGSARLIGEVLYERTKDLSIDAIGGLEAGAIPLTTAAVISYQLHGQELEGFWVRDKAKSHGTEKVIEGNLKHGSRVAIVDDVVTRGNSVIKAAEEVKKIGCKIVLVLALVDRLRGADQLFREHGIESYDPIFTIRDLGVIPDVGKPTDYPPLRIS